jgi:hypothetical protein
MKLTNIYNSIKEEMGSDDDTTKIFSRLRKQLDPNNTDKTDKPVVKPNVVYVDLDNEIINGTTGKPIVTYILPKNGDGSYEVIYKDGEQGRIAVSNDAWDEINNLTRQNMNEEFKRMQELAGLVNEFYAPDYVLDKYGFDKAKEIEQNIFDEEDENPNLWDLFTSLTTPEETEEFIQGFIN